MPGWTPPTPLTHSDLSLLWLYQRLICPQAISLSVQWNPTPVLCCRFIALFFLISNLRIQKIPYHKPFLPHPPTPRWMFWAKSRHGLEKWNDYGYCAYVCCTCISEGGVLSKARNCGALERLNSVQQFLMAHAMEEPGEQCTVVFTLIVTELASECGRGGGVPSPKH